MHGNTQTIKEAKTLVTACRKIAFPAFPCMHFRSKVWKTDCVSVSSHPLQVAFLQRILK